MSNIPLELIHDILFLLPIKSLLRFKCLCKPVSAIIDSKSFVARRSSVHKNSRKLIMVKSDPLNANGRLDVLNFDDGLEKESVLDNVSTNLYSIDQCNGLFVFYSSSNQVCVWNPSTRQCRILPPCPVDPSSLRRLTIGFDYSTDDYKVLALGSMEDWVFRLKSSSWEKAREQFPGYIRDGRLDKGSCFSNDFLYFLCNHTIVRFNVATEKYFVIAPPVDRRVGTFLCLHCFGGQLSLKISAGDRTMLYVGEKDGVDSSWVKLYSVRSDCDFWRYEKVLGYSREGDTIFMHNKSGRLNSYPLHEGGIRPIPTVIPIEKGKEEKREESMKILNLFLCNESLVSIY